MINYNKLEIFENFIDTFFKDCDWDRKDIWMKMLEISEEDLNSKRATSRWEEIICRATQCCIGNFNYWEEAGKITWPKNINGQLWFDVVMGRRDINTLNLVDLRKKFLIKCREFLKDFNLNDIYTTSWWTKLTDVFGKDPLKKRETLLYIILTDLGFKDLYCPNKGCIDYNIIVALRFFGIIEGYEGNIFDLATETKLRNECLVVCDELIARQKWLNVSILDNILYSEGKRIRKTYDNWEDYFCYRLNCYYY